MLGKKKPAPRRLECHGGPKDGDWMDVNPGVERIYFCMDLPAQMVRVEQRDIARGMYVRIGIYQVFGFRFKTDRGPVLKWMGEQES